MEDSPQTPYWSFVVANENYERSRRDQAGNESDNNDDEYDEIPYEFFDEPPDYPEFYNFLT